MKIYEAIINHNAVKLITNAVDTVLNIDPDDDRRKEESVIQLSYIAGVADMARVMKEVMKARD